MSNEKQEPKLELKDCVAIKRGWAWALVATIGSMLVAGVMSTVSAWIITRHDGIKLLDCLIVAIVWPFYLWIDLVWSCNGRLWRIVKEYWRRNVVGYTMRIGEDQDGLLQDIYYGQAGREKADTLLPHIFLPLGGWCREAEYVDDERYPSRRLKLAIPYHKLPKRNSDGWDRAIRIEDRAGNRLRVSPTQAFSILTETEGILADAFIVIKRAGEEKVRELGESKQKLVDTGKNFDDLVHTTVKAITEILKTSRFKDSKEGARIRKLLSDGVRQVLGSDDPRIAGLTAIEESRLSKSKAKS